MKKTLLALPILLCLIASSAFADTIQYEIAPRHQVDGFVGNVLHTVGEDLDRWHMGGAITTGLEGTLIGCLDDDTFSLTGTLHDDWGAAFKVDGSFTLTEGSLDGTLDYSYGQDSGTLYFLGSGRPGHYNWLGQDGKVNPSFMLWGQTWYPGETEPQGESFGIDLYGQPVPEPATWALLALGGLAMSLRRRK